MKRLLFCFLIICCLNCDRHPAHKEFSLFKNFINDIILLECEDSIFGTLSFSLRYEQYDDNAQRTIYNIPDSIEFANFYKSYAERLEYIFYIWDNQDTSGTVDRILNENGCDIAKAKSQFYELDEKNPFLSEAFDFIFQSFHHNEKIEKPTLSIDSLAKISLSYFGITGCASDRHLSYHYSCGTNPFSTNTTNICNISIGEFCREAIKSKKMMLAFTNITKEVDLMYATDQRAFSECNDLIREYESTLRTLLLSDTTLKEVIENYYNSRKNIEPFTLENNTGHNSALASSGGDLPVG